MKPHGEEESKAADSENRGPRYRALYKSLQPFQLRHWNQERKSHLGWSSLSRHHVETHCSQHAQTELLTHRIMRSHKMVVLSREEGKKEGKEE